MFDPRGRSTMKPNMRWPSMRWFCRPVLLMVLLAYQIPPAQAAGSGLNVAVVVNRDSADSVALGNYYCERRRVHPQNLVRISWRGGKTTWTRAECQSALIEPLMAALAERRLSDQILFVVLSMDIPFRVVDGQDANSTTSVLFYGFKTNDWRNPGSCRISPEGGHRYFASELAFRPQPASTNGPRFLATLLTAEMLEEAKQTVDRGLLSDRDFRHSNGPPAKDD